MTVGGGATAAMDRYAAAESRRLQRAVADAERACSGAYMDELLTAVTREMERAVRSSDDQSVSRTVRRRAGRLLELGGSRRAKNQLDFCWNSKEVILPKTSSIRTVCWNSKGAIVPKTSSISAGTRRKSSCQKPALFGQPVGQQDCPPQNGTSAR